MACPSCHHRNSATANFCERCGASLAAVKGAAPASIPSEEKFPEMSTTMTGATPESPASESPAANWVDLRRAPFGGSGLPAPAPASVWSAASASEESRRWAMGAHLSAIAGGFLGGVPAFLGPLVVWLVRKDQDDFAAGHGRAALNFNLSVLLYAAVLVVFTVVTFGLGALLAAPVGAGLGLAWLVLSILGAVRASHDQPFRYPLTIPFVR